MAQDYSSVTEVPGNRVSRAAVDMVWTRYVFAGEWCTGKKVLEAACGPGVGLRYLSQRARNVVAGDYTASLLSKAKETHGARVPLVQLDAHALPFRESVFDVVVLFEAIYFLADLATVFDSCRLVLAPGGTLIVVTVNPEWPAFNPSPLSTRYWSASELKRLLANRGFSSDLYGGFPTTNEGLRGRVLDAIKRLAVRLHLIPRTMKGKEFMKRMVFGRLDSFPGDIVDTRATYHRPAPLDESSQARIYKVLYAVGRKEVG